MRPSGRAFIYGNALAGRGLSKVHSIGVKESRCFVEIGEDRRELTMPVPDHAVAVRQCLAQLTDPEHGCLKDATEVSAIGFKAVHGGRYSGVQRVTEELLQAMEQMGRFYR